jgi:hypothetical protein
MVTETKAQANAQALLANAAANANAHAGTSPAVVPEKIDRSQCCSLHDMAACRTYLAKELRTIY